MEAVMSVEIKVPPLGESIVDATIATWLKHEGEAVHKGDTLVEFETDKINVEENAEEDGVLQKMLKQVGDAVGVGEVIGMIAQNGGASGASAPTNGAATVGDVTPLAPGQQETTQAMPPAEPLRQTTGQLGEKVPVASQGNAAAQQTQRPPSPLAQRIAAANNVDLSQVQGTSPHGRITKEDVITYMEQNAQTAQTVPTQALQSSVAPAPAPTQATAQPMQKAQPAGNGSTPVPGIAPPASMPRGRE